MNDAQNSEEEKEENENEEKMASDEETPMDEEDEEPVEMSANLKKLLAKVCQVPCRITFLELLMTRNGFI